MSIGQADISSYLFKHTFYTFFSEKLDIEFKKIQNKYQNDTMVITKQAFVRERTLHEILTLEQEYEEKKKCIALLNNELHNCLKYEVNNSISCDVGIDA